MKRGISAYPVLDADMPAVLRQKARVINRLYPRLRSAGCRKGRDRHMKWIMTLIGRCGRLRPETAALAGLLTHTLYWFLAGGLLGGVLALCMRVSDGLRQSYMLSAGAACALLPGYIGGMVYLLRRDA